MDLDKIIQAVTEAQTKAKKRKFKEAIEIIVNLKGIDLKRGGRQLNLDVTLPHAFGEAIRVAVIGDANFAFQARKAGAAIVLETSDIEKFETDRDAAKELADEVGFFIAQAELMPLIGRVLGPVLGPRGKMPRPVPANADLSKLLAEFSNSIKLRMRKNLVIQAKVGERTMDPKAVAENIQAIITALEQNLEKGMQNIDGIITKTTMGPAIRVAM